MPGLTVDQHIHDWLSAAQHDVDTALVLLDEGRAFNCVVFCGACVVKMMKGLWVATKKAHPPRTENPLVLAKALDLPLAEDRLAQLVEIAVVAKLAAWPTDVKALRKGMKKAQAQEVYDRTEEMIRWLKERF
jgi:HEPN domain-containing protein